MKDAHRRQGVEPRPHRDEGQISVLVLLATSLFVLTFVGFGVDMTNLYFHRQAAQGAADSACQAGAMDMLISDQGVPFGGFSAGTAFDCAGTPSAAPCKYAKLNGYSSPGLTDGQDSNLVSVSFPSSVAGVTTPPVALAGNYSFMQVDVKDRVKVIFSSLITRNATQDVLARSRCGVITSSSPVPIIVLHPTLTDSFSVGGSPQIAIIGGPSRSIQVNSDNTTAAYIGGSGSVDLTQAGPTFTGGDFGVFGGPQAAPGGFTDGTSGHWLSPSAPIQDPLKIVPPPTQPAAPKVPPDSYPSQCTTLKNPCQVAYHTNGCPDPTGCDEYGPGYYPSTIKLQNVTAIFDPGIYYLAPSGNNTLAFDIHANATVRPSTATGDGSGGTLFYMTGNTVAIGANTGSSPKPVDNFYTCTSNSVSTCSGAGITGTAVNPNVICPSGQAPNPALPASLQGNIFLAPCTTQGTYNTPPTPQGPNRGLVFFQSRSDTGSAAAPSFNGGGGLLIVGTMYFHDCPNSVTGPCSAPPTDYQDVLSLVGNSGSTTRIVGEIITDQLSLSGSSAIDMQLNPYVSFEILKVALLQ